VLSHHLLAQKLNARRVTVGDFREALTLQLERLLHHEQVHVDFQMEMSRFIAKTMRERTIEKPEYLACVQAEVERVVQSIIRSHRADRMMLV
jgi:predicted secreted Zn-dependent protease